MHGFRGLIYLEKGEPERALQAYRDAQALEPPPYEFVAQQHGVVRALIGLNRPFKEISEAVEVGLSAAEGWPACGLILLRTYAELALANEAFVPLRSLRWSSLYRRACEGQAITPVGFDPADPQSFTIAIAQTPPPPPSK
jgi:hypothetical protein